MDLLPVESHILTELDIHERLTGSELAAYLDIAPARISLLLKGLEKRRIVSRKTEENNALRKPFQLTATGRALLHEHDRQANRQLEQMTDQFSRKEVNDLAQFFLHFSDGVNAPHSRRRKAEHPLRFLARRLTRWLGQLGNDFYCSGLSPLEWHILLALKDGDGKIIGSELVERFFTSKQVISKALRRLTAAKLVSVQRAGSDKREKAYGITRGGEAMLSDLEARAAKAVSRAMRQIPARIRTSRVISNAYRLVGLTVSNSPIARKK